MRVKKYGVSFVFVVLTLCALTLFSFAVDPPENSEILEYITSSGNAFIDTLIPATDTSFSISTKFSFNSRDSQQAIFGVIGVGDSLNLYSFESRRFCISAGGLRGLEYSFNIGNIYDVDLSVQPGNVTALVNGEQRSFGFTNSIVTNSNYYIFARNSSGSPIQFLNGNIYDWSYTANNVLVRDFVPIRMTDGRVGLWDYVDGTFFPSVGSGSFTAGPVVEVVGPSEPEVPVYSVTVNSSSGGSASSSVSSAEQGEVVTLTATPDDGYRFVNWEVISGGVTVSNNQFTMGASDVVIKANFEAIPVVPMYSVTVNSSSGGIASASVSSAEQGYLVTLTSTPDAGYEFKGWQVVSGGVTVTNNQFTMGTSDVVINALFEPIVYSITLSQSPNGSATVSASTGIVGDVVYLSATPVKGFGLSHWEITPSSVVVSDGQFIMPASNVTIRPVFVEQSSISSGFTYNSGVISGRTRSTFDLCDFSFGSQPAGKYLINIYHWGDSYDVNFYILDSSERYYPVTNASGVSTFIYNHSGGDMSFDGSFSLVNTDTTAVDGSLSASGSGDYLYISGNIDADAPLSWTFNIENIIASPLDVAQDSDFGIYSLIVGFLRNQFNDMKAFLAEQFTKITGSEETQGVVDSAAEELNKEVEDLNNLSGELDQQSTNLEQQFTTDFAIPDSVSGQASNFQSIYSSLFGSLGIFSIFIWLPIVFAVIKKLLRL